MANLDCEPMEYFLDRNVLNNNINDLYMCVNYNKDKRMIMNAYEDSDANEINNISIKSKSHGSSVINDDGNMLMDSTFLSNLIYT